MGEFGHVLRLGERRPLYLQVACLLIGDILVVYTLASSRAEI